MTIRIGQVDIDGPVDFKGQSLVNVGGISLAEGGEAGTPQQMGEVDIDVTYIHAATEAVDTRTHTLTYTSGRFQSIVAKAGAQTIKSKSFTYDGQGRVSTRTVVIGAKTVTDTFTYVGTTLSIQSRVRNVVTAEV